ncbi:MAG: UDP-N-acetylmuramate--L-alanine ligase [Ignavibacteriales bacterium]|nr:MAG: UDP-N-acetylmuramate--L-alanine ligase [Ignavibacteriales bacterium]
MLGKYKKIHFVGIGGIGMSGIAEVLHKKGYVVSGSDKELSTVTERLEKQGIRIYKGHREENINDADLVVFTSAATQENPEIIEAKRKGITAVKRAEMLAECMRGKYGICIAGTHGKTTTTSMVGLILTEAGVDPTILVGGNLKALGGTNARLGNGEFIVVEADEFDRTFLKLTPTLAAITNLEAEHLDTYKDLDDIKKTFIEFANKIPFYGFVAICTDDKNLKEIKPSIKGRVITYGVEESAEVKAINIMSTEKSSSFTVKYFGEYLGEVKLNIPGVHNIKNSLAALIIAKELKIDLQTIKKSLESFRGADRRFEIKYDKEIMLIDDYAHHPTEVSSTLDGIRKGWNRRLIAVFQPHLFTRTKDFAEDFGKAFLNSDIFVCTDIYPSREEPIAGITGQLVADAAEKSGHKKVIYEKDKTKLPEVLKSIALKDDIIITMGAGDIWKYGEMFLDNYLNNN